MEANWVLPAALAIALLGAGGGAGYDYLAGTEMTLMKQIGTDFYHQRLSSRSVSSVFNPLREIYQAEIGVREATGRNDGPRIAEYLRYCGLAGGYEWCAAFVSWCHGKAGYPEPRNAWAAALFPSNRIIWRKSAVRATLAVAPGDVFGIYNAAKKRIAHCGFVDEWDGKWCITVEGNVENAVVRKRRSVKTIYAVSRWNDGTTMARISRIITDRPIVMRAARYQ